MTSDDAERQDDAREDRELREDIQRSIKREDEREPTLEELAAWSRESTNEEARTAPPRAQAAADPAQLQTTAAAASSDSSRNGKRRGGPSSVEGKANSKTNATTHGIFSSVVVLRNESRTDYDTQLKGLFEYFRPEGFLEDLLVEKLAMLIWRHRRLLLAEGDELTNTVDRRPLRLAVLENVSSPHKRNAEEGVFWGINTIAQLQHCIDQFTELRDGIAAGGLDATRDRSILEGIYGFFGGSEGETLFDRYEFWLDRSSNKDGSETFPPPILDEIDAEIVRLTSILEAHDVIDPWAHKIVVRRPHHIPDSPAAERLLRYEASLERAFERTLAQLERMQRLRKGQPVPPRVEVDVSV
jgi:hypothetical protein